MPTAISRRDAFFSNLCNVFGRRFAYARRQGLDKTLIGFLAHIFAVFVVVDKRLQILKRKFRLHFGDVSVRIFLRRIALKHIRLEQFGSAQFGLVDFR